VFTREAGRLHLHFQAPPEVGLPFGRYPRLLLAYLSSEAVRTQSREIPLGPSLSRFLRRLAITPSGGEHGPIGRFRDQMQRLFATSVTVVWQGDGEFGAGGFHFASESYLWWDARHPEDPARPGSSITLSADFYAELLAAPVPIDLRALRALVAPLALDVYCWLTFRLFKLSRPLVLSWPELAMQFGTQAGRVRDFRRRFIAALEAVLVVYPEARVRAGRGGLTLLPSPSHVRGRA
jgi:hypothetical protein